MPRCFVVLSGLCTAFLAAVAFAADVAPLTPFQADYQVLRNGKQMGQATLALHSAGNGTWEFSNETHGTRGMAGMLGLDVVEKSTFHWRDGAPEGLRYSYSQQAAMKSRQRSVDFDWDMREARSSDGKSNWVAPLRPGAIDRSLVTVALMSALKSNSAQLEFPVVDKDRVAEQRYAQTATETVVLPGGPVKAVRVERQRDDSARTTTTWFAPQRGWLPVQIEQVEKNGETITLRLASSPRG